MTETGEPKSETPGTDSKGLEPTEATAGAQVGDQARQMGDQITDHARALAGDAAKRGASLVNAAKDQVATAAHDREEGLADQLDDVAKAVHRSGEQLEGHQDWMAHLVERGSQELSSLATALRSNDLQGLFTGLKGLAQRQPAVFAGASLAAGFAMVRLSKVAIGGASRDDLPHAPEVNREPK